jgi:hypothetical protein
MDVRGVDPRFIDHEPPAVWREIEIVSVIATGGAYLVGPLDHGGRP